MVLTFKQMYTIITIYKIQLTAVENEHLDLNCKHVIIYLNE